MSSIASQKENEIEVTTPLGKDELLLQRMTAIEEMGRLFEFRLELLSENEEIKLEDLLGKDMTVRLDLIDDNKRYFHGYVSQFSQLGGIGKFASYSAILRPWLWFLTRTSNSRIFQEMTVPEILKKIFRDHGFTDFEEKLNGDYRKWEYCVQYRETDFNFVSRLMEQEGIYYYFTHQQGVHTLILSDSISSHARSSTYGKVPYYPPSENALREEDYLYDWYITQQVQPGAYVLNDFDYERPKAVLKTEYKKARKHAAADYEIYDYPGEYKKSADGDNYVRTRFQEMHSQYERVRGRGNVRGFEAGLLFELTNYPRDDQNKEYLIISAIHEMQTSAFESGHGGESTFSCEIEAIFSQEDFRPARTTPKPVVQGPQTAIVVGKKGEEIWTDEYGRVKVQFHWDREGNKDENSSCWVRVSQSHAGKGFGGIDIPRIGEEVIIEFLEGDTDHPIITGRVYNGDNRPPNQLPDKDHISGYKSNSTPGGNGYNSIMFDDDKDKELIELHAQKDMDSTVENDLREHVLNNRDRDVANDETVNIGMNLAVSTGKTMSFTSEDDYSVDGHKKAKITIADELVIKVGKSSITMKNDGTITIKGKDITIKGSGKIDAKASGNVTIKGKQILQN